MESWPGFWLVRNFTKHSFFPKASSRKWMFSFFPYLFPMNSPLHPKRVFLVVWMLLFTTWCPNLLAQEGDSTLAEVDSIPQPDAAIISVPATYTADDLSIEVPEIVIRGVEHEIAFSYSGEDQELRNRELTVMVNGQAQSLVMAGGKGKLSFVFEGTDQVSVQVDSISESFDRSPIPLWLSLIPPLLAILMALVFREVITALFTGIFVGAAIIHVYLVGVLGIGKGLLAVLDTYVLGALADEDHVSVILFSMLIGAIVAVISRNGGMQGVVNRVSKFAKNARSGQLATWFLGIAIFFDDYANTLVVGNTMRPVTDRLRISREKLSYIVDSTAAPISAIAFITTWIGAELGYIEGGLEKIAAAGGEIPGDPSPYGIFVSSLQYSFYPILTLVFMFMLIRMGRDFGPMLKAERRARSTGQVAPTAHREGEEREKSQELDDLDPVKGAKPKAFNAVIPILVIIVGTIVGLVTTGLSSLEESWVDNPEKLALYESSGFFGKLSFIIGAANSYAALIWASLSGLLAALLLTLSQRIMNLETCLETVVAGFKTMLHAMIILILAWGLAKVTDDLHTADFITRILGDGVPAFLIPAFTFLLAAVVSFSTGSSWGTMAILYPLIIPATWAVCAAEGYAPEAIMPILYNTVACVLAGSVLGDHCSPISDTTILSSLATSTNHIDHVRTQLPYALTVGTISVLVGTIPGALGVPFWITLPVALGILFLIIRTFGKPVAEPD